jgi:hypothetical protein
MAGMISCCGYRCSLCLIYKGNLKKDPNNRHLFRDILEKYYGDKQKLEDCHCDGCKTPDSEHPDLITKDCKIRPCAISKGLKTCADCPEYPCEMVARKNIERCKIEEKYGAPILEKDYKLIIMPYESRKTLEKIRQKRKSK